MTEAEWLSCTDPTPMLNFLKERADKRRCLLFACACERRLWGHPDCEREKVEATESYADGQATAAEVLAALEHIGSEHYTLGDVTDMDPVAWANDESERSAEYAANIKQGGPKNSTLGNIQAWDDSYATERNAHATLLREIFGTPFLPAEVEPSWLTWNLGTVVRLAKGIYEDRVFDHMPILADALEDAGCQDVDILSHCRQQAPHVRGCWVLDLLLGKK
jgi:hypothetical protein